MLQPEVLPLVTHAVPFQYCPAVHAVPVPEAEVAQALPVQYWPDGHDPPPVDVAPDLCWHTADV